MKLVPGLEVIICTVWIISSVNSLDPNQGNLLSDTSRQRQASVFVLGPIEGEHYDSNSESESKESKSASSSESDASKSRELKTSEELNLRYIGCYDVLENDTNLLYSDIFYDTDKMIESCLYLCKLMAPTQGISSYVLLVQDKYCRCNGWEDFELIRVDNKYCNADCRSNKSLCGGSYTFSAYCLKDHDDCNSFNLPPINVDLYAEIELHEPLEDPSEEQTIIAPQAYPYAYCAHCTVCTAMIKADNAYIPDNSISKCMHFCNREVHYYLNDELVPRLPTRHFALGWANKSAQVVIPICSCLTETDLEGLEELNSDYCDAKCPGDPEEVCGAQQKETVTVYARDSVAEPVPNPTFPPSAKPVINGSTIPESRSTTEILEHTTKPSTTSFTPKTTRGPNTIPEISTTSLPFCTLNCTQKDQFGTIWNECVGEIQYKACPGNASGQAYWRCLKTGQFSGKTPNYSDCKTPWYEKIHKEIEGELSPVQAKLILSELEEKSRKAKNLQNKNEQYFGHEITGILEAVDIVLRHKNLSNQMDLGAFENLTLKAITVGNNILENSHTWEQLEFPNVSITKLIQVLEEAGFELLKKAQNQGILNYTNEIFPFPNSIHLKFESKEKILGANQTYEFSDLESAYIRLPEGFEYLIYGPNVSITGMSIRAEDVIRIFPNDIWLSTPSNTESTKTSPISKSVNSQLMSLSLTRPSAENQKPIKFPGNGVEIKLLHDVLAWGDGNGIKRNIRRKLHPGEKPKAVLGSSICVYWNTTYGAWSDDGCKLIRFGASSTYCECNHLTSFALLMDRHNYVGKDFALEVLTLVLCPLSIISLFVAITIFTLVRSTHGARTTITKNLAVCLLIGNTLVLLVTDRHYFNMNEGVCTASAMLTHYIYLSAFIWMGIEGYHLYKMMVYVFDSGSSHMKLYRILAYGCPLVFVALIALIGYLNDHVPYGGDEFCWLQGSYIWAFLAPVAIVVLGNLIVLIITMKTAYRVKTSTAQIQARTKSYKTWIRGCFSITIILGLTWISGFFMMVPSVASNIAAYIFTILNASQGFLICIFHCLLTEKVRMAAEKKNIVLPSWLSSTSSYTSEHTPTSFPGRRVPSTPGNMNHYPYFDNPSLNHNGYGNEKRSIKPSASNGTISSDSGCSMDSPNSGAETSASSSMSTNKHGSRKNLVRKKSSNGRF